jgi:succinate dehydrogenase / fumarate reductase cytochrome b subunit
MNLFSRVWNSSLGKKYIMAVSGCALFLFVIGHLVGNLQFFMGPEVINHYGHFLQSNWEIKWPARIGLLVMVVLHVVSAARLTAENRAARGSEYACLQPVGSTYASRTMMMSGLIVAAFVIYHLLHYTVLVPAVNLTETKLNFETLHDAQGRHDIFDMMVIGFSRPLVSLFYMVASHGVSAMFQSLGLKKHYYRALIDRVVRVAVFLIFIGYVSIPVSVICGYGKTYADNRAALRNAKISPPSPQQITKPEGK